MAKFKINQVRIGHDEVGKYYMVDVITQNTSYAGRDGMNIIRSKVNA